MLAKGTHDYAKFIKPSELSSWARDAGLNVMALRGMTYHPFKQSYRLSDDVAVNYLMHTVLPA